MPLSFAKRAARSVLIAMLVLLPREPAHALSCLPTSPVIGAAKAVPRVGSGGTLMIDLNTPATFYDTLVLTSGAGAEPIADIDAYAALLDSYASSSDTQQSASSRTSLSISHVVKNAITVKTNDMIAQGPPFHVCGYSVTAIGNAEGELHTIVSTRGYGSYSIHDSVLTIAPSQKTTCTQGACSATVSVRFGAESFTLSPGGDHEFDAGPLESIELLSSSVPDIANPADEAAIAQYDPWGLLTYAVIVLHMKDGFAPAENPLPFSDVPPTHPYAGAIAAARDAKRMEGDGDGTFRPDDTINRAEMTKILVTAREDGTSECSVSAADRFADTNYDAWYGAFVCAAQRDKLVTGYPDKTFRPANSISFAEAAALIARAYELPLSREQNTWYMGYYHALEARSAVPPTVRSFEQLLTRAEAAYILSRLEGNR